MAQVIKAEPTSTLTKICPLRWFELQRALAHWIMLQDSDSAALAEIGPVHPIEDEFGHAIERPEHYAQRITLGLAALSKVVD